MSDHRRWRILIDENGREWGTTHDSAANEGEELIEVVPAAELDAAIEDKGSGWDSYISRRYKELLEELRVVSEQRDMIYLAIIIYPHEGGVVLGAFSTEKLARAALEAFDGAPGFDATVEPVTVDAKIEPIYV